MHLIKSKGEKISLEVIIKKPILVRDSDIGPLGFRFIKVVDGS